MHIIESVKGPFYGNLTASEGVPSGGINTRVTFDGLKPDELEYIKIVARVQFHRVVLIAQALNEGLSFRNSVRKSLGLQPD